MKTRVAPPIKAPEKSKKGSSWAWQRSFFLSAMTKLINDERFVVDVSTTRPNFVGFRFSTKLPFDKSIGLRIICRCVFSGTYES